MKPTRLVAASVLLSAAAFSQAPSPWQQPTAALAEQIATILGPGQANLTIRNLSTIPADEIPVIRTLLEQDLRAHGVQTSNAESANTIRVTLSENLRERLWVGEVIQGNETRVAMVRVDASVPIPIAASGGLTLRRQAILGSKAPVLAAIETTSGLVVLEPDAVVLYSQTPNGWSEQRRFAIGERRVLPRNPRGTMAPNGSGGFDAFVAGAQCSGAFGIGAAPAPVGSPESAPLHCGPSDDPWPILQMTGAGGESATVRAFYNASRNYFTGVVTPAIGLDLPPFYSAALVSGPSGAALLIGGIDGKVQVVQAGALKAVSGTRDWGSDFAVLHSGCGTGDQAIASGSGDAPSDSLRAYEISNQEAVPVSQPLAMDGSVIALWTGPDGKSVYASVRMQPGDYEVDRVTAQCN
jgi:hypothetical protein